MGRTALLDAFAQSDLDMRGFRIINVGTEDFSGVTSVGLSMPPQFVVIGTPIEDEGIFGVSWVGQVPAGPENPSGPITPIPLNVLPLAKGVGGAHSAGIVPDPGVVGNPLDYLGRDMNYHTAVGGSGPSYQPTVPDVVLVLTSGPPPAGGFPTANFTVTISDPLAGVALFYSVNNPNGGFQPIPSSGQVGIVSGQILYAYGAKVGYSNSDMAFIQAPGPPGSDVVLGDDGAPVLGDDSQPVTVGLVSSLERAA